jgi:hypothetical protein
MFLEIIMPKVKPLTLRHLPMPPTIKEALMIDLNYYHET